MKRLVRLERKLLARVLKAEAYCTTDPIKKKCLLAQSNLLALQSKQNADLQGLLP